MNILQSNMNYINSSLNDILLFQNNILTSMNTINDYKFTINNDDDTTNDDLDWINWNTNNLFNINELKNKFETFNSTINNFSTFLKDRGLDIILVADQANAFVCTANDTFTRVIDVYNNLFNQNYYDKYTNILNDVVISLNNFTFDNTIIDNRDDIYTYFDNIQNMCDPLLDILDKDINIILESIDITNIFQQTLTINSTVGIALSVSQQAWNLAILLNKHNYKTTTLEDTSNTLSSDGTEDQKLDTHPLFPKQIDSSKINNIKNIIELLHFNNNDRFYTNEDKSDYIEIKKSELPINPFLDPYNLMTIYDANELYTDNRSIDSLLDIFKDYNYLKDININKDNYINYCIENNIDIVDDDTYNNYYNYYHNNYDEVYDQYIQGILYITKYYKFKELYQNYNINFDITLFLDELYKNFYGENNLGINYLSTKEDKNSLDNYLLSLADNISSIILDRSINFKDELLKYNQYEKEILITVTEFKYNGGNTISKILNEFKINTIYLANKYNIIAGTFKVDNNLFNKYNNNIYHNYDKNIISDESDGYSKTEDNVIETIYDYDTKNITKIKGLFDIYIEDKFRGIKIYDNINIESSYSNNIYNIRQEIKHLKTETVFDNDNVIIRITTGITNVYRQQMIDGKIDFVEARQKSILKSLLYLQVKYKMDKYIDNTWIAEIPRLE